MMEVLYSSHNVLRPNERQISFFAFVHYEFQNAIISTIIASE